MTQPTSTSTTSAEDAKCSVQMSNGIKFFSRTIENKTLKEWQYLMSGGNLISTVRLQSTPENMVKNLDLRAEAERMVERGHFRGAVRFLTYAIDKIEMDTPIFLLEKAKRMAFFELYRRRIWCLLKACEHPTITSANKLKNYRNVIDDCTFLLRIGLFKEDIQAGTELYNDLEQMEVSATLAKGIFGADLRISEYLYIATTKNS
jgi:hypothetical protein